MEIEILSTMQMPNPASKPPGQTQTLVLFRVDGKRTDSITIPKATSDVKEIESAIAAEVKNRAKLPGHKFEVK